MSEEARLDQIEDKIDELDRKVDAIDKDLSKYRGMVGGVLLAITAIVTFLKWTWDFFKEHISWQ